MSDSLRPRGTVEVTCGECRWCFWVACDDPSLPDGPWTCISCETKNADAELRAMGVDPDALAERGLAFVNKLKAELRSGPAIPERSEKGESK